MSAPEKIYLYPSDRAGYEYEEEWGNKPWGENYVEYTRTDVFIEKACKAYCEVCKMPNFNRGECKFINEFRSQMEGVRKMTRLLKSLKPQNNITDEELVQARNNAYRDALDKIEYHSGEPTFDDGWSAAIWYLKKRNTMLQSQWKPSEEQMGALKQCMDYQVNLRTLYNDLKKLRDE